MPETRRAGMQDRSRRKLRSDREPTGVHPGSARGALQRLRIVSDRCPQHSHSVETPGTRPRHGVTIALSALGVGTFASTSFGLPQKVAEQPTHSARVDVQDGAVEQRRIGRTVRQRLDGKMLPLRVRRRVERPVHQPQPRAPRRVYF